jgi:NAD-dependent SIR2 family protein deacetylase
MKPDIVFFGEGLPEIFHESMAKDKDECDLLIVIGSSLKVRPVALIPSKYTSFMVWAYKYTPYSYHTSQMPHLKEPYLWNESTC